MSALLAGELRRTLARRLVKVVFASLAIGIVVAGTVTFLKTHAESQAAYLAKVAAAAAANARAAQAGGSGNVAGCPSGPNGAPVIQSNGPGGPVSCGPVLVSVNDPRFHLTDLKGILDVITAPLVLLAVLIGASVIGAEWPSRTITTILTWEPRRLRVFAAKLLSALVVCLALALASMVALGAVLMPSALLHGTTMGTTGAWWWSLAGVGWRSLAMVGVGTMVGFSIASVGRNTAAALGVLFAYVIVIENVAVAFLHGLRRWLLVGNAFVFVSGNPGDFPRGVQGRSVTVAGVYLLAIAVSLYIIAAVVFQRRDVA